MDVTSGAAVAALLYDLFDDVKKSKGSDEENGDIHQNDGQTPWRVLDLCCAPGYVSVLFCVSQLSVALIADSVLSSASSCA